jgi:hypothetical protein
LGHVIKDGIPLFDLIYNGKTIIDTVDYSILGSDGNFYFLGRTTQNLFAQKSSASSDYFVTSFDQNGRFIFGKQLPGTNDAIPDYPTFFNDSFYFHIKNRVTGENIVTRYRPAK